MAQVERLLDQIIPEHYILDLDVDMAKFRYTCKETIDFELTTASHKLTLHGFELDVTLARLESGAVARVYEGEQRQTLTFHFEDEVPAGKHTMYLEFTGDINESLHGFYRSSYESDGTTHWIATTQFEAVHAREAIVCIDEPAAKAVFEVHMTVPAELTALANTDPVATAEVAGGRKRISYAPTPKMSTYLLAFVIGTFEAVEQTTPEGVTVRVYARPGMQDQLEFALDIGGRMLSYYGEYFDIPYPLGKLDMIALPDFGAGAMENWGLVTYRETALLLDPTQTALAHKLRVAEVVAHELAHQWFGNLVTIAWWSDLWLNEGFATWVSNLAMDHLFPDWHIWTHFILEEYARAQEMDGLANTHPIEVPVPDPHSLDEIFDAISYSKGASIINMLHAYLGAEDFRRGLHAYLTKHMYSNTVTHDLWSALGSASGKPVDEVMSKWTTQSGYPLLSFDNGEVHQRRFFSSPREAKKAANPTLWPVPFEVILPGGAKTAPSLLEGTSAELPDEIVGAKWFKPNPGETSFFRTHYTDGMIDALTAPLADAKLNATDRYGAVSDVLATTEAGVTDTRVALKLIAALRSETDYVVWNGVSGGLGSINAIVEDEDLREQLDAFGHWLVQPNVLRLGWEARAGEHSFDTLMRPLVLQQAVRFDDEAVTKEASKQFDHYLATGEIDPDLRSVALFAAARHGGVAEFEAILNKYRSEEVPQVKIGLLGALGRFRDPAMIEKFIAFADSDDVRPQDLPIALAWGLRNREARDQVWHWLKQRWNVWVERYGGGGHILDHLPLYVGSGFATHAMAKEIRDFFAEHPHPSIKRPSAQAVEAVELKADWYERDKPTIAAFLDHWKAR